ncbi:hypothetical protein ABIA24_003373 [Sinorhizobium fredii]|uniref:hypothetical protein n=1 Tax=Rhizobium fredii TaxID=380 RepID=UPI0035167064
MLQVFHGRRASLSERIHRKMQRDGVTIRGHKLWTDEEIKILRENPNDRQAAQQKLPHRTAKAIEFKRGELGLAKPIHFWTAAEISKLRRMYPRSPQEEICAAFPHSTWINIRQAARYHGFRRERRAYKPTGHAVIDQIREKCHEIKWSMADLDREARTKTYFKRQGWYGKRINYKAVGRALEALEGQMTIKWPDECDDRSIRIA